MAPMHRKAYKDKYCRAKQPSRALHDIACHVEGSVLAKLASCTVQAEVASIGTRAVHVAQQYRYLRPCCVPAEFYYLSYRIVGSLR